ncbi:MAG: hypothetical protein LBO62_07760 [Endomicrobium sp.]|nr:hypothetical protein [Endomicrobium sp.]
MFPKLKDKEDYIIYGPAKKPYASYKDDKYIQHRGTHWDWQGLLGQKVPRFDNRIIAKCRLIPRLNVCNAKKQINKEVSFLLNLKNMRYSKDYTTSMALTPEQINYVFKIYSDYIEKEKVKENNKKSGVEVKEKRNDNENPFTKTFWKNYVRNILGGEINAEQPQIAEPKDKGRSSFCKPALHILHSLILSGKNPCDYYKELIDINKNTDVNKGLIKEDYKFLLNMKNDWNSISIPDTREENKNLQRDEAIEKLKREIAQISNRIVRHRLFMLFKTMEELDKKFGKEYGKPDKVIFEIAREDFIGKDNKEAQFELNQFQKANKNERDNAAKKLEEENLPLSDENILKTRLLESQGYKDIYDTSENRTMNLSNIANYEVDHIVPRSASGSDSMRNLVITKNQFNREKLGLTPYEYFKQKRTEDEWETYKKNVTALFGKDAGYKNKNKKKLNLLISDKIPDSEKRKTDLQATSYIEKFAQKIAGLYFGFGINTAGDKRKVLFFTGHDTANVRSKLNLNRVLYNSEEDFKKAQALGLKEKNRNNKKHHALDALVLGMLPEIKVFKKEIKESPDYFHKEYVKKEIDKVIPETIKQIKPKLRETIYALRCRIEDDKECYYFISHFDSSIKNFRLLEGKKTNDKCAKKNVDKIFDLKIKNDFQNKLSEKGLTQEKWDEFLSRYTCGGKRIKKIAMIDDSSLRGFTREEVFNSDGTIKAIIGEYGHKGAINRQWLRREDRHQGQIVYKNKENKWTVEPVYVFESVYNKTREFARKYGDIKFFQSGQIIELCKNYKDIKAGIYKLRTIKSNASCKIENINDQKEITKNIEIFIEQCGMEIYKKQ